MSTWTIDGAHSEIAFKIKHLVISTVRGTFKKFSGVGIAADDTFENAAINFTAETASIETNNEGRDEHLRGADFFDSAIHPTINFVSTSFTKKDGNLFELVGDLTMKGVTKSVSLTTEFNGIGKNMGGQRFASFNLSGTLNRNDFGLTWNSILEMGGLALSEELVLEMTIEAIEE